MGKTEDSPEIDTEKSQEKKPSAFPKSLFFIIGNEFCERYSFYGMHTILILYLTIFLHFDDNTVRAWKTVRFDFNDLDSELLLY